MKFKKEFLGLDGFFWWFGVVENRIDPLLLGRCQVRIFGSHTDDLADIPSEDLPWAHPIHSVNNQTFSTPKEGDYVFGFYVDGKLSQFPVIVGIVPGIPGTQTDPNKGFADLRTPDDIAAAPKKPKSISISGDGSGASVEEYGEEEELSGLRYPGLSVGLPTNSNLARNEDADATVLGTRKDNLVTVESARGANWDEPVPAYGTQYPYNKAMESESGHVLEFDDTPGAERVHIAHRTGSFVEWYPTGTKVEKIVKNNYKIVMSDDHLYVSGRVNITVDSHANIRVAGDVNLEALNDFNADIAGNMNFNVGEAFKVKAQNIVMESSSQSSILAGADVSFDGINVNINNGNSIPTGLGNSLARGEPNDAPFSPELAPADKAAFLFDSGEDEEAAEEHIQRQLDAGVYTQEQLDEAQNLIDRIPTAEQDDTPTESVPVGSTGAIGLGGDISLVGCEELLQLDAFSGDIQLSENFTLKDLTFGLPFPYRLRAQRGLTKGQIACNLSQLALNVLEPILAKYPSMFVTSAFRIESSKSQHAIGQAADLQFGGVSRSDYYDIAIWIRDNVPHDQLLLEYQTTGTRNPWIHVSFNPQGNRKSGPTKHMTFVNHRAVKSHFVNLA